MAQGSGLGPQGGEQGLGVGCAVLWLWGAGMHSFPLPTLKGSPAPKLRHPNQAGLPSHLELLWHCESSQETNMQSPTAERGRGWAKGEGGVGKGQSEGVVGEPGAGASGPRSAPESMDASKRVLSSRAHSPSSVG